MAKKPKTSHAGHIKRNTQGTSNEISFDVLDAARASLDRRSRRQSATPRPGVVGIESSHGWQTPFDEVERRKKSRRRRRLVTGAAVLAVVAVLVFGVGSMLNALLNTQATMRDALVVALADIEKSDEQLLPYDETLVALMGGTAPAQELTDTLSEDIQALVPGLLNVKQRIEELQPQLVNPKDKEAANQALAAVNARVNMIASAQGLLETLVPAYQAQQAFNEGWTSLYEGDQLARQAVEGLDPMTTETVSASMTLSEEALNKFLSARDSLQAAQDLESGIPMDGYVNYVQLRIDAQYAAIAADQAYLDRDSSVLAQQNEAYNAYDSQAALLYATLDTDVARFIMDAAMETQVSAMESYKAERQQAGNADETLRGYLGAESK